MLGLSGSRNHGAHGVAELVRECGEHFDSIEDVDLGALLVGADPTASMEMQIGRRDAGG